MRAVLWVFSIAALIYLLAAYHKENLRDWLYPNIVRVNCEGEAQNILTSIKWTAEGVEDTVSIYKEGQQLTQRFRAAGFNTFLLYYNGRLVDTFEQFKNSPNSPHQYEFLLWKQGDSLVVDLKIKGSEAN